MSHRLPHVSPPDSGPTIEPRRHPWLLAATVVLEIAWIVVMAALVMVR